MWKGFKSLLAGLAAGTVIGVLFSPKKGNEIRKNFKKELQKGGSGISTLGSTLKEMGKDIGESVKESYQELSQTEVYQQSKQKIQGKAAEAKKEISEKARKIGKKIRNANK